MPALLLADEDPDSGSAEPPDEMWLDNDDDALVEDDSPDQEDFVERDPSGRYGRYAEVLGKGAMKIVYRAYDRVDCKEVAWNQAKPIDSASPRDEQAVSVQREILLLRRLNYKGIISLYHDWVDPETGNTNFITELCSGSLLGYRRKHKHVSRKAVKNWGRQILRALAHLHSQSPTVIHRDLKCDNILVKCSADSTVKIGDFGSAALLDETHHLHSVVGTPEFMAPEMYDEDYNELVDVYSFGMCMLELITGEYPYRECENVAQIYKKVTSGVKPKALRKVKDIHALRFINQCLLPASQRPTAKQLLNDPFFRSDCTANASIGNAASGKTGQVPELFTDPLLQPGYTPQVGAKAEAAKEKAMELLGFSDPMSEDTVEFTPQGKAIKAPENLALVPEKVAARLLKPGYSHQVGAGAEAAKEKAMELSGSSYPMSENTVVVTSFDPQGKTIKAPENLALVPKKVGAYSVAVGKRNRSSHHSYQVTGKLENETTIRLELRIEQSGRVRKIVFPYDLGNDSPKSVAEEMVRELEYPDSELLPIADLITAEIAALVAHAEEGSVIRLVTMPDPTDPEIAGIPTLGQPPPSYNSAGSEILFGPSHAEGLRILVRPSHDQGLWRPLPYYTKALA